MIINLGKNKSKEWQKCFVIFPTITLCNKLIMMQHCYKRWNDEWVSVGDFSGYSFYVGGWEYK